MPAGKFNLRSGAVETQNARRLTALADGAREDASAAAKVEPTGMGRDGKPVQKLRSEQAAPTGHPDFVGFAGGPPFFLRRRDGTGGRRAHREESITERGGEQKGPRSKKR